MGMDVSGKNPKNKQGEYFRASVWSWHSLWDYCEIIAEEICKDCENPHHNQGDGLNSIKAKKLGQAVLEAVKDGRAAKYLDDRKAFLDSIPNKVCIHCHGTGKRQWFVNSKTGESRSKYEYNIMAEEVLSVEELEPRTEREIGADEVEMERICNACGGKGFERPWITNYGFDLDHLEEWGTFCVNSGGFEIW